MNRYQNVMLTKRFSLLLYMVQIPFGARDFLNVEPSSDVLVPRIFFLIADGFSLLMVQIPFGDILHLEPSTDVFLFQFCLLRLEPPICTYQYI